MNGYTLALVLYKCTRPNHEGYPIFLRLTINRKPYYSKTGYRVHEHQWDDKAKVVQKHPNAKIINTALNKFKSELDANLTFEVVNGNPITPELLKGRRIISFNKYAEDVNGVGQITTKQLGRIQKFLGREPQLTEINAEWLRRYQKFQIETLKYDHNTMVSSMKFISKIIYQAQRDKYIKLNPFLDKSYKTPQWKETTPTYLVAEERNVFLDLLFNKKIADEQQYKVLAYFCMACFTGLRISDWITFNPKKMVIDGDIRLRANKNGEYVVMKIGKTLQKIINIIRKIGPLNLTKDDANIILKDVAKAGKCDKVITTHVGRHSFGYLCASMDVSKETTAELMGIDIRTVEVYYHIIGAHVKKNSAVLAKT